MVQVQAIRDNLKLLRLHETLKDREGILGAVNIGRETYRREERSAENFIVHKPRKTVQQIVDGNIATRVRTGRILRAVHRGAVGAGNGVTAGCHIRAVTCRRGV